MGKNRVGWHTRALRRWAAGALVATLGAAGVPLVPGLDLFVSPALAATGTITTVAGNGLAGSGGDGGSATSAYLNGPPSVAYDSANNLLIGDHNNHRVRKVGKNGVISTVAGNGIAGFAGDGGQAVSARLNLPGGIVLDGAGNLYIADNGNNRVRKVAANGIITTLAGTGVAGSSGDGGPATSAQLSGPTGVEIDRAGNLFVSEYGGHRIRKLAANGIITTVAGNGIAGFAGDGGAATSAQLFSPAGIELDYPGNLYIADFNNGRVRKVATNGVITTVAGNGSGGFGGDGGPATSASVWSPNGIAIDRAGNLFIADTRNQRVRKVDTAGTITTVAGNGNFGFSGDGGPATAASFRYPDDVAIDGAGNVAIADQDNHRIRRVEAIAVGGPIGGAIRAKEVLGGENPCEPCVTDDATDYPITTSTGNFWHTFDHLATPGRGLPISLSHTYNSLSAGTDGPLGYGWQFNYAMSLSVVGSTVTVRQENGSEVQFAESGTSYVAPPRVIATLVKNPDASFTFTRGAREIYKFNPVGQLVSQKDLNGYVTSLAYNAANQLSSVTEPAGRTLNFSYTGARITGVSVPASPARSVAFSYDGAGNLSDITDVAAGNWHFTYDGAHRMLTMRSPRQAGLVTNQYDASGRVAWQSDPLGRTTYFDYTTIPGATKVTDPRGNVTVDTYAYGQLVSKTTGYGTAQAATWNFVYDPATAAMSSATDPNARTTTTYHDGFGNPVRTTDALGRTTTATYNALNQPLTVTDAKATTTTLLYDPAGNMTKNSRLLTSTGQIRSTIYTYGDAGHPGDVTAITDPNAKVWAMTYNANGDLASETDPLANKNTHGYDSIGRRTSTVSAKGNATGANPATYTSTFTYNAFGQLLVATDPLGHQIKRTYDADQNLASLTDELNKATTYGYDAANQLTVMTRADNTTLQNSYDPAGNLTAQKDGKSNATTYAYDPLDRVSSMRDPLGRTTTYAYDKADNRTSLVDPAGQTTTFSYDAANQLSSVLYSDPATPDVAGIAYDVNGQRTSMSAGTGTSSWEWDSLNRLTRSTNGAGATVRYGYDLKGQLTNLTYPNNQMVTRSWDAAGRLASVKDWLGRTTTFSHDANDNLTTQAYANGTQAGVGYNAADQLLTVAHTKAGTGLASLTYTRDDAGQVASASSTGLSQPNESYAYTALNQLASVNAATYGYDAADNLTKLASGATLAYDAANQATSFTQAGVGASLSYDAKGNRSLATGPALPARYRYDQANRLTEVARFQALVAGGDSHSLALGSDGLVRAWGANTFGQLGDGLVGVGSATPVTVVGLTGATAVGAGADHSLALKGDGSVWAWGDNSNGQLGVDILPVPNTTPIQVPGVADMVAVAGGGFHSLALRADGTVWAWGSNISGQLGNGTASIVPSPPVQVSGLTNVIAIAGGRDHSLALKADGSVWAWGFNAAGQLGNNSTTSSAVPVQVSGLSGVTAIAGGGDHSVALKADASVWAWGANDSGQLGVNSTTDSLVPVQVSGLSGAVAIAAGSAHSLAARADGTGWAWGANASGQLGNASTTRSLVPVAVSGLTASVALAAGTSHSLALRSDAGVWTWGNNTSGQLGNGATLTTSTTPVAVSGLVAVQPVAAARYAYDGDGMRASKTVRHTTTAFAWDLSGELPLLLQEGSTSYLYGPGDVVLAQIDAAGAVVYHHQDQLGSTRLLTDAAGAVAGTRSYDAYGTPTASTGSAKTPFGYAGQYTDTETGFQYLRARYYDPATANFLTRDPIEAVTREPYGYVGGDPLNKIDPSGLEYEWRALPGPPRAYKDTGWKTQWIGVGIPIPRWGYVGQRQEHRTVTFYEAQEGRDVDDTCGVFYATRVAKVTIEYTRNVYEASLKGTPYSGPVYHGASSRGRRTDAEASRTFRLTSANYTHGSRGGRASYVSKW